MNLDFLNLAWTWLYTPLELGLIGLCIGSFLNVVIYRLPLIMRREWVFEATQFLSESQNLAKEARLAEAGSDALAGVAAEARSLSIKLQAVTPVSLSMPRSACPGCGRSLAWHQNIPLLGWFLVRGQCATCESPVSIRYPLIEGLTSALFVATSLRFDGQPVALLWCGFMACLVALTMIDWDTQLLPDSITLPLLWAGIAVSLAGWGLPLTGAVTGALVGYLPLWFISTVFMLVTGKQGMGNGDFKLLAALGAWLGWQMVLPIILIACATCIVYYLVKKLSSVRPPAGPMPFGPFLCTGAGVVMFMGPARITHLLGWI